MPSENLGTSFMQNMYSMLVKLPCPGRIALRGGQCLPIPMLCPVLIVQIGNVVTFVYQWINIYGEVDPDMSFCRPDLTFTMEGKSSTITPRRYDEGMGLVGGSHVLPRQYRTIPPGAQVEDGDFHQAR